MRISDWSAYVCSSYLHVGAHEAGLQQAALHERAVRFVDQWHPLLDGSDQVYPEGVARLVTQARRAVESAHRDSIAGEPARHGTEVADHHGYAEHAQDDSKEQHNEKSPAWVVHEPGDRLIVKAGCRFRDVHAVLPCLRPDRKSTRLNT